MEEIFKRRSIRKFTPEPVTDEELEKILRAGFAAPSAHNNKEWVFIVIKDRASLQKFIDADEYSAALKTSPVAVLACADLRIEEAGGYGMWQQDLGASLENMCIEAVHLGLATNWIGVYPLDYRINVCREVTEIPEYIVPVGLLAIGHAEKERAPINRYMTRRVHFEKYIEPEEEGEKE